jgi:hypothetical protein
VAVVSGLVVDLRPIRNAIEQSQKLGNPATRPDVVARVIADIRAGHDAFRHARELQKLRLGGAK